MGLALIIVPTLINLARWSWSSEAGAHGPLVLATGIWLIVRDRSKLRFARRQSFFPAGLAILAALPVYVIGRITNILALETGGLYVVLLATVWIELGPRVLRAFWFPCIYFLFLITPPENWLFVATHPIKIWLSEVAVDLLSALGYAVGRSGVVIQVDGYQLLVATACSGVNSLIGICALSLFYVYLMHGSAPRYALLLTAMLLPVAILANLIRVISLVLVTHYFSGSGVFDMVHNAAGMGIFLLAVLLLIGLDHLLQAIAERRKRRAA